MFLNDDPYKSVKLFMNIELDESERDENAFFLK